MSFIKDAEKIRNKIRKYKTESMVIHLLNRLHSSSETHHRGFDRAWISCLMLDWVLEIEPRNNAVDASRSDVHRLLEEIWDLQSKASDIENADNIYLTMRCFVLKQLRFQEDQNFHILFLVRLHSIICEENVSVYFEDKFKSIAGISLEKFFVFSLFLLISFKDGGKKTPFISYPQLIAKLNPVYKVSEIEAMIKALGSNLFDACKIIKDKRAQIGPLKASDYHAEPLIIEHPLISLDVGISIYHTYVATIGISEFILRTFKTVEPQKFRDKFTKIFERYVHRALLEYDIKVIDENALINKYRENKTSGKVVDFLCPFYNGTVFIDAKGVEPPQYILVSDSPIIIKDKLKNTHLKGISQISECIEKLESISFDNLSVYQNRFALIVTHQDFYLGSGKQLNTYLSRIYGDELLKIVENKIPLDNIHFCSISDLEGILVICKEKHTNMVDFLSFCTSNEKCKETANFDMQQNILSYSQRFNGDVVIPICSESTAKRYEKLHRKLVCVIDEASKYWGGRVNEMVAKSECLKNSLIKPT
ncbi:GapS1 family protein [Aeromonas hydrophila]|uniref:GapS1 family protein n=1 Tax=Aeromonas hydrophila TaxID=644 RepID=UPI001A924D62|nr:hypothetical protein [Aeromonas hydrophila]MBO0409091.1 hypothetical protein [Aeromonas hydrophila]